MSNKKLPLRKCTGCQEMKNKKDLIRIVKNNEGDFFLDYTGKKNGRGAYICANLECMEKAHKFRGLEKSFKSPVPKEIYKTLEEDLLTFLKGSANE